MLPHNLFPQDRGTELSSLHPATQAPGTGRSKALAELLRWYTCYQGSTNLLGTAGHVPSSCKEGLHTVAVICSTSARAREIILLMGSLMFCVMLRRVKNRIQ